MIPNKILNNEKKIYVSKKKNYIYYKLLLFIACLFFIFISNKINQEFINKDETTNNLIKIIESGKLKISNDKKCYISFYNQNLRIIHLILTRFLITFYKQNGYPEKLYTEYYIQNGIRVMKKYLFPSLESQSCKNFTWILILGDTVNITYIKYMLNLNNSFESKVIYQKDIKKYVRNRTKGFDVLITTQIDYDDRIYYDAVNDVRKSININRPMILYGYKRGLYFLEWNGNYYEFYSDYQNIGAINIFLSLITVLNKVNDTYIVYDIGPHTSIRKELLEKYKSFGIKELDYEPAIFDSGDPKFVYVRQNCSVTNTQNQIRYIKKHQKVNNFKLSKFYGFS